MRTSRRNLLRGLSTLSVAAAVAGCNGDENGDSPDSGDDSDSGPESRVDSYLTENDANLYEGTIEDLTGEEEVTIAVGAGDDGLAYDPPAARIDLDTTVVWEWTGRGGQHNINSESDIGSDFEYASGELIGEAGHTWSYQFEETGAAVYYCEAHRAVGHHGGLVVE